MSHCPYQFYFLAINKLDFFEKFKLTGVITVNFQHLIELYLYKWKVNVIDFVTQTWRSLHIITRK